MTAKQLVFGESAHARLIRGMNTLADALRVTLYGLHDRAGAGQPYAGAR